MALPPRLLDLMLEKRWWIQTQDSFEASIPKYHFPNSYPWLEIFLVFNRFCISSLVAENVHQKGLMAMILTVSEHNIIVSNFLYFISFSTNHMKWDFLKVHILILVSIWLETHSQIRNPLWLKFQFRRICFKRACFSRW